MPSLHQVLFLLAALALGFGVWLALGGAVLIVDAQHDTARAMRIGVAAFVFGLALYLVACAIVAWLIV